MSETIPTAPTEAAPAPIAEPVAAPAVLPVVEAAPEAPVVATEAAPIVEAPAADAVTPHTETPSLLETIEAPGTEKKPDEPAAPIVEAAPVEAPIVYELKFPEGIQPSEQGLEAYTNIMRDARVAPEAAQKLVDAYVAEQTRNAENSLARQHETFGAMRKDWQGRIMSDPELGGSGFDTTKLAVARARDALVPDKDRKEFNEMLSTTGAGDHPALWRMLYRFANMMDEPVPVANIRPPSNPNPAPRRGMDALFDRNTPSSFYSR